MLQFYEASSNYINKVTHTHSERERERKVG